MTFRLSSCNCFHPFILPSLLCCSAAASSAAKALLLLLPEWRLPLLLQQWQALGATRRLAATLRATLPPCRYSHWIQHAAAYAGGTVPEAGGGGTYPAGGAAATGGSGRGRGAEAAAGVSVGTTGTWRLGFGVLSVPELAAAGTSSSSSVASGAASALLQLLCRLMLVLRRDLEGTRSLIGEMLCTQADAMGWGVS